MKSRKWIFLLVMALLLAGGLGGIYYTEQRVENSVRELLQQFGPACVVGQVHFSALDRTLTVQDIAYRHPKGDIHIDQAEMLLPPHMFFSLPDTEVELLEVLVLRQVQMTADGITLSVEERKYTHLRGNPDELLQCITQRREASLWGYALLSRLSFTSGTARNISIRMAMTEDALPVSCIVAQSSEGPYLRGTLGAFQVQAVQLRQGEQVLATLDKLRAYDIRLPSEEKMMALLEAFQGLHQGSGDEVAGNVLSHVSPLVARMVLENFQMTVRHQSVSVQNMEIGWRSVHPGSVQIQTTDLAVPLSLIADMYRPVHCPGLETLHLDMDMQRMAGPDAGQDRYLLKVQARDVGSVKLDLTLAEPLSWLDGGDPLLEILMLPMVAVELRIVDQQFLTYLVGNMGSDPAAAAVLFPQLLEEFVARHLGDQLSDEDRQHLEEFLRNPGEFSLHVMPKEAVTLLDVALGSTAWKPYMQMEMKPGKEPLLSRVQRVFGGEQQ